MDDPAKFLADRRQSLRTAEALQAKSGSELAELLLNHEWLVSPELVNELIRRLAIYDILLDACEAAKAWGAQYPCGNREEQERAWLALNLQLFDAIAAARSETEKPKGAKNEDERFSNPMA